MIEDIKEILIDENAIKNKILELGEKINRDYEGKEVILIGVLKGSVVFMADLLRCIKLNCSMDFMAVSSYGHSTHSSGIVRILKDLDFEIEGKDVIIVEDIIDSGVTLKYLMEYLQGRKPKSLEVACLLDKPERRKVSLKVRYIGFTVPDYFLVGYGLDYAERYRNLPFIGVLDDKIYS